MSSTEIGKMLKTTKSSNKEALSYTKLNNMIIENHPIDPDTQQQFMPWMSITVPYYNFKLADSLCCGCIQLQYHCKTMKKGFKQYLYGNIKHKQKRPESLEDEPSSCDELNDTYKGLSNAAIHLGEGAVLYLQMMKTFSVLFFILSIINIPVYILYSGITAAESSAMVGQYENQSFYTNFMIGNLGLTSSKCASSSINF